MLSRNLVELQQPTFFSSCMSRVKSRVMLYSSATAKGSFAFSEREFFSLIFVVTQCEYQIIGFFVNPTGNDVAFAPIKETQMTGKTIQKKLFLASRDPLLLYIVTLLQMISGGKKSR